MTLKLRTLGHATLALYETDSDRPILITDPWLIGSCYWRSWWLERPPTDVDIAWLARAQHLYLTHEHPDHLHPPSLRRLKRDAPADALQILTPDFPRMQMDGYLAEQGFGVDRLLPGRWRALTPDVRIMSLPVLTNDSVLLIDTPNALIINQNDVKPGQRFIRRLGAYAKASGKRVVLLRSHSPAGPAHSYFRDGARIEAATTEGYVLSACRNATAFGASDFVPFASQAIFRRADSEWANEYRVGPQEMAAHWRGDARLLPPFVTLDLDSFAFEAAPPTPDLPPPSEAAVARLTERQASDQNDHLDAEDLKRLEAILNQERLAMLAILPRGLAFDVGDQRLFYNPKRGRLSESRERGGFRPAARIVVPAGTFKEAILYGHVADLFIGMFMDIHLDEDTGHEKVNLFYYLMTLRDYGYVGLWRRLKWAIWAWRGLRRPLPAPPNA